MTKYRALVDIPPNIKAGEVVEVNDELIPEFKKKLELVSEDAEVDETTKSGVINPSRTDLKARAAQLGIDFAPNISTARLMELVKEAEDAEAAKLQKDGDNGDGDKDSDEG